MMIDLCLLSLSLVCLTILCLVSCAVTVTVTVTEVTGFFTLFLECVMFWATQLSPFFMQVGIRLYCRCKTQPGSRCGRRRSQWSPRYIQVFRRGGVRPPEKGSMVVLVGIHGEGRGRWP